MEIKLSLVLVTSARCVNRMYSVRYVCKACGGVGIGIHCMHVHLATPVRNIRCMPNKVYGSAGSTGARQEGGGGVNRPPTSRSLKA